MILPPRHGAAATPTMIGTQIGDLKLVARLGEGGMARVYLAEHTLLNDLQAVKILDPRLSRNPQIVTRFLNEGRAAVKLRHPNLVQVFDVGQLPNDGPWYMVMEYLDGGTLARFIASQGGPMSVYLILHILAPVLSCLQWIHDRRVVHRDLKPENLFLVQMNGDPHFAKVLDLGVALVSEAIAAGPGTVEGTVIGTPVYMAPEQLRGERVTALADSFALGTIIYEMSTGGWFPWQRDDESRAAYCDLPMTELYYRQQSTQPIDPRRRFAGISEGWAQACLRAIEGDPSKRPQTDRDLALMFAEHAPSDGFHEEGFEIIRQRAPDLLQTNHAVDTVRSPRRFPVVTPPPPRNKLRYQLGAKLGAGGMAEVFEGRLFGAEGFERRVAIKRVLAGISEVSTFVTMFVAEAQIASRLNHVNVVSVIDFDRDSDNRLCLVMEYVHGKDLATVLEAGPIAPSLTIYIVVEMLRGLGYAHAAEPDREGIVHRDVSPQNLMLSYEGAVKVTDFGIARARSASGNAYSETVRGKVSYMSPEQCNGDPLDARSDLFAVGIMMYEMLTHRPLFTGTAREIMGQILHKEIPPPSVHSPIPRALEAIVMKLLARDPNDRYPNAEAVIIDLLNCADAPRDGRGDLVQQLAQRFPDNALRTRISAGAEPSSGRGRQAQMAVPTPGRQTVTDSPLPAMPTGAKSFAIPERAFTAVVSPSTLSGAASQSVEIQRAPRKRRWARLAGVASGVVIVAAGLVAIVVSHRGSSMSPVQSPPISVASPDAALPAEPSARADRANDARIEAAGPSPTSPPSDPVTHVRDPREVPADRPSPEAAGANSHPEAAGASSQAASPARTRHAAGQLIIAVTPWALIDLNGKPAGQTPFIEQLPAGRYSVRITNDDLGKDETVVVVVSPEAPATIRRKW